MGSSSRGKDGEGTSGVGKIVEEISYEYEQERRFMSPEVLLLHSNLDTNCLRAYEPPPPLATQQVPAGAMQRHGAQQHGYIESVVHERLKLVKITWNHPGTNIAIVGSWDNWKITEPLQRIGQNYVILKTLPVGIYQYRFIVDGYLTHAPEFPSAFDDSGYAYNILDLQDYIPHSQGRLSDFEEPPSPPSSYDNIYLSEDEFSKPPPELPPQMAVTTRDEPSSSTSNNSGLISTPRHLELNHLFIYKSDRDQLVALRSTHRFQHKYVTMVLYKSLCRDSGKDD